MIVEELIKLLQICDQEARVTSEGCDCIGDVEDVERVGQGEVLLTRQVSRDSVRNVKGPF